MEKTKNSRSGTRMYWIIGILLVVALAGYYFLQTRASSRRSNFTSQTATVSTVTVVDTVQTSGSLTAYQSASLNWNTSGTIETVNVKAGDQVHKGDVLAILDNTSVPQSIRSAQADLIPAEQALEDLKQSDTVRAQTLVNLNSASDDYKAALNNRRNLDGLIQLVKYEYVWQGTRQILKATYYKGYADAVMIANADNNVALAKAKLDDAQRTYDRVKDGPNPADLALAQARVDAAQAALNSTKIIAPFDGDVIAVLNRPNDLVNTSTVAVIIANRQTYIVDAQVDETDITKMIAGQSVDVKLDALPNLKLTGKVQSVSLFGQSVSGIVKYDVLVAIPASDIDLPLGATANLTILVGEPVSSLAVPITAVYSDDTGDYVLLANGVGLQKRVNVQSGEIVGNLVAITGAVKEGDKVVLANSATTTTAQTGGPQRRGFFGP